MLANVDSVKDDLSQKFSSLRNEEQNITKEFTEKYGNGEFDMENGTFTLSHKYNRFGFFDVFIDILKPKEINRRIKWQKE